jgi:hypothetical protein
VRRFVQEPFVPNRNDPEVEPSISTLQAYIARGTVSLCTSKLVAGSSMVYSTPHASIMVRGRRLHIEVTEQETRVALLEGDVTVRGGGEIDMGGTALRPGQMAVIGVAPVGEPAPVRLMDIPEDYMEAIDDRVTVACMARNTVFFDVAATATGETEIVPTPTTPEDLPDGNTVSNAVITQ